MRILLCLKFSVCLQCFIDTYATSEQTVLYFIELICLKSLAQMLFSLLINGITVIHEH